MAALAAGLGAGLAQVMSLAVFSAAGQVAALATLGGATPLALTIGTAMILNAQLLLLGLTVGRRLRPGWPARLLAAFFLTDAAFAVAAARGRLRLPTLLGAGASMYLAWNLGTALGLAAGRAIPDIRHAGIDFVLPLIFLGLLVPLLRGRAAILVAVVAGGATLLLLRVAPTGVAVLGAGLAACPIGAWWSRRGAGRARGRA